MPRHIPQQGFSLIEMAVVLFIVVLLLGSLLVPFATQVEQRRIAETQRTLDEIKEALVGYALSHRATNAPNQPYLPCPDATINPVPGGGTANDGVEDRNGDACAVAEGNLPWVDLGIGTSDAWGNHFRYRVDTVYANRLSGFALSTPAGAIEICKTLACAAADRVAAGVPAVILSSGKNGYGAIGANRAAGDVTPNPCPPTAACSNDETENMNNNTRFISRTITGPGTPAGEFDDIVAWISPNVLFNRMVAAQRLP